MFFPGDGKVVEPAMECFGFFLLQHFVCAKCEKPFLGHRHYEKKGLAYCETHYNQVNSTICAVGTCVWQMLFHVLYLQSCEEVMKY